MKQLLDQEVQRRLTRLRNMERLHDRDQHTKARLRADNKYLKQLLGERDARITELEQQVANKELERKTLASYLYKAGKDKALAAKVAKPKGKQPGAPAFHRPAPDPATVTERIIFSLKRCPMCNGLVGEPVDQVEKYEEDIDLAPRLLVKHYTVTRHWCPSCETFVKSLQIPYTERIGTNVLAYVLYARYRLRLPVNKIRESLFDLHNFAISEGEVIAQLDKAKDLFGKDYEAICELIKTARAVYADETGWRMDGENWYLWAFVTEQGVRYSLENTRGSGVAKQDRVIISDGYAAYGSLPGDNQQCWVHLLRRAKDASPTLYQHLVGLYERLGSELTKPVSERDPPWFAAELEKRASQAYPEPTAERVQNWIAKHGVQLLACLQYDGILPENNTAERAIRPHVIMRKIFGGNRSPKGAETHAVNTSVITTEMQRHPETSFFDVMLPMLRQRRSGL